MHLHFIGIRIFGKSTFRFTVDSFNMAIRVNRQGPNDVLLNIFMVSPLYPECDDVVIELVPTFTPPSYFLFSHEVYCIFSSLFSNFKNPTLSIRKLNILNAPKEILWYFFNSWRYFRRKSHGISVATNYLNHIELHYTLSILLMTDIFFVYIYSGLSPSKLACSILFLRLASYSRQSRVQNHQNMTT